MRSIYRDIEKQAKGHYITVFWKWNSDYVKRMIFDYYDQPEYEGTLFIISYLYWRPDSDFKTIPFEDDSGIKLNVLDFEYYKTQYNRIIMYDLERLGCFYPTGWNIREFWDYVDEIWCPWLENYPYYLESKQDKFKFKPLRYVTYYGQFNVQPDSYRFNLLQIASLDEYRCRNIKIIQLMVDKFIQCSGIDIADIADIVTRTKFVLDTHRVESPTSVPDGQNVERIAEAICIGKTVLSEHSPFNYFEGIGCIEYRDLDDLQGLLVHTQPHDYSREFFKATYHDSDYEVYCNHLKETYLSKYSYCKLYN